MFVIRILAFCVFLFVGEAALADHRQAVKVGIPDNPPITLQYMDKGGKPKGLAIDVLNDIAANNTWHIQYIQAPWSQLLQKLKTGEIDVLTGIAYSKQRALRFDFSQEALISNWAVIFRNRDVKVQSALSLRGKRVALVPNTPHAKAFVGLLKKFDVTFTPVPVKSYTAAFEQVRAGDADVALVSRLFGILYATQYNIIETGINFNPVEVRFAVPKGKNADILVAIDQYLSVQKSTNGSNYQKYLQAWLKVPVQSGIPVWSILLIGGSLLFLCVLWLNVVLLRHKVRIRGLALREHKSRFKGIFDHAEISIWNEDLSEVKKDLDKLRKAGVRDLRLYLEQHEHIAWDLVSKVKVVDVNAATLKLFGVQSEAHFFYQLERTFGPQALGTFIEECCAIWEGRNTFRAEADFKTLQGKIIHTIISFRIPKSDQGFRNIPVTIFDLTERKAAEEALKSSEQKLSLALQASNAGYWLYNASTKEIFWSDENSKLLGYEAGEVQASFEAWRDRIHENERDEVATIFLQHLTDQSEIDMEYRIELPSGEIRWMHNIGKSILDDKGQTKVVTGIQSDITVRKHAELNAQEAMKMATKANAAKSEFLASMSHELRTPLNAILGFGQMMQFDPKNKLSKTQSEHIENILLGGNQLLQLVNKILDLAKTEANQTELYLEDVGVFESIEACIILSRPHAERSEVTLINTLSREPSVSVHTDGVRLKQIMHNLLSNAIKFNKFGGSVCVEGQKTSDDFFRISVVDTGIAIAKQDFAGVFQSFCRHGRDALKAQEGIGIGLQVTKLLAEQMAGRVGFESEKGVGSTFWIELPLSSNEEIVIWDENLRTGIDRIDKDHQILHDLLNKVARSAPDDAELTKYIDELADYSIYHFRREEAIMKACSYKGLRNHRFIHQHLLTRLNGLTDAWHKDKNPGTLHDLRKFLRVFFVRHAVQVDVGLADLAKEENELIIQQALDDLERDITNIGDPVPRSINPPPNLIVV